MKERFPALPPAHQKIFADHLRTSVVLAGEIFPSSKGRGYVMRKIVRRLLRYAYLNGVTQPFVASFIPVVVELMGQSGWREMTRSTPNTRAAGARGADSTHSGERGVVLLESRGGRKEADFVQTQKGGRLWKC